MNYIDTETFNDVPIKHGTYKYTSTCEPMIVTYAFGMTAPVQVWDITTGAPMPDDLAYILDDEDELLTAHSSMFDRSVLARPPISRTIARHRWRDTMVKALAHGLPGGLDRLCEIFKIGGEHAKHKEGKKLIQLFCKPQAFKHELKKENYATTKAYKAAVAEARGNWAGRCTRLTHPNEWQRFIDYAVSDIEAMREVDRKLPKWNYGDDQIALWHLDQKINDRGLCVDVPFAQAAIRAVAREQDRLAARGSELSNGEVESTTKRDVLLAHLVSSYGIELPDLRRDTIERRMNDDDIPPELRELLAIRLAASSTSTSKYQALVNGVQPDGRLRGTLQFNGASRTRRAAGRTFQPTNLPRPDMKNDEVEFFIDCVKNDAEHLLFDDVMRGARNAVRGCIIAPPEKKIVVADLSNIEGRDAALLAGEQWKLDAFREFDESLIVDDRGNPILKKGKRQFAKPDLYCVSYGKSFNVDPHEVGGDQRQIGKVQELMLQYGGGVGAFVTGAETYGIDLNELAEVAGPSIPADVREEAEGMWEWAHDAKHKERRRFTCGLSREVFVVCDSLKRVWRRAHPEIVETWADMEDCARSAITNPGNTFRARQFAFRRDGSWLRIRLPSGNFLCYLHPSVGEDNSITYMGMNQYTRKWQRIGTYGGKFFENACQGLAGDILRYNWPAIEDAGFEIVLTVYDENVTYAPLTAEHSSDRLAMLMTTVPPWAQGLPLAAAGFETQRYRKD